MQVKKVDEKQAKELALREGLPPIDAEVLLLNKNPSKKLIKRANPKLLKN